MVMNGSILNFIFVIVLCYCYFAFVNGDKDFYDLLDVTKDADDRTIRRAFKKLAIKLHPDKNTKDPEAHDKFVKINRAYEVLKDEELRKKYDLHGEAGLKDDFHGGHQYQSWQFYNENFGIYDEDTEIVTLSRSDFEQSILRSDDKWFVNFYSPQCSHCHTLAPAWRLLARELEGAVRIGAVNCGDDWMLCREQGIFGYPSLVFYPSGQKYQGSREKDDLIDFVVKRISATVHQLTTKNVLALSVQWEQYADKPWLIDFCDDSDSCLSVINRKKLAAMLDSLVNVGNIDCVGTGNELCEKLAMHSGVAFFPIGQITPDHAKVLHSFDAKELASELLSMLPDLSDLTEEAFMKLQDDILSEKVSPCLINFFGSDNSPDLEMKKLPVLLKDIKSARVNCSRYKTLCSSMHIHKLPSFAVFKTTGGYEVHHGRQTAHDVAAFARDCSSTNVRVLDQEEFQNFILSGTSSETWFVDFFAPWCPPCMKLLPEFRKAAREMGDEIRFGTVDCTIHQGLCQQVNVHTYPTTILYNQSTPHSFVGLHSVDDLLIFIEDIRHPPVVLLDDGLFQKLVTKRSNDHVWLVDFFAPWCGPCQQLAPEWRQLAKMLKNVKSVSVGQVDCVSNEQLCRNNQVNSYPTIRLYPAGRGGFISYDNWFRDAQSLRHWVQEWLPSKVTNLQPNDFFNGVLNSEEPWVIDFYAPWCGHCQVFAPEFEAVAEKLSGRVHAGKVNCDSFPHVCQNAAVRFYPTVRFYSGTEEDQTQSPDGMNIASHQSDHIVSVIKSELRESKQREHDEL